MNCRECRRLIAVSLYAELPADERSSLEAHVRDCPDCRAAREKTPRRLAEVFPRPTDLESPDWEKNWRAVASRLEAPARKSPRLRPRPAWAWAGFVLLAVFIAGYFTGRGPRTGAPKPGDPEPAVRAEFADSEEFLRQYTESLHPLLLSWLSRSAAADPSVPSLLEREIVKELLSRTKILRALADRQGDPFLKDLARDIDTLLREIDSLRPDEARLPEGVLRWVEDRRLPAKVRFLASPGPGI